MGIIFNLFFRIKLGEKQYMEAFNSELDAFKERITKRAQEKLQKAMEEYEEVCFRGATGQ